MDKTRLVIAAGLTFIIITAFLIATQGATNAQDCRIVRITGGVGERIDAIELEPKTVWVNKGDCVIWVNLSRSPEVKIKFAEGKKCEEATDAPSGFEADLPTGCYVTGVLHKGATASLRFIEEGTFSYIVEATPQERVMEKGEIVVK